MNFLSFTLPAALLPGLLLLVWFRNSDRFPEPWPVVIRTFFLGAASVVPILIVGEILKAGMGLIPAQPWAQSAYMAFMLAAIPEESFKYLILVFYCMRHMEFDEPMDGIVYGVTVSLGFASLENILYVSQGGMGVAVMRALTSVPGHAMMGAVMGYYAGLCLKKPGQRMGLLVLAWLCPVILHGLYDFPLMLISALNKLDTSSGQAGRPTLMFICVIVFMWILALRYKNRLRKLQEI